MMLTKEQLSKLMLRFGMRKWPSGFVGDFIGEYNAFGAPGISPGKLHVRE